MAERRGDADIAAVGALLGDTARCRILLTLDDGRALPASRLAAEAGVSAATASSHLRKLTDAGLLSVEPHGRHRYYRLAGPQVGGLIEALTQLAPAAPCAPYAKALAHRRCAAPVPATTTSPASSAWPLMRSMLERGQLSGGDGCFDPGRARQDKPIGYGHDVDYHLTDSGHSFLGELGVDLQPRRLVFRYCIDWSEQAHHLAGGLGRELLTRLVELDWIRRASANRAVQLTDTGASGLADAFGVQLQNYSRAPNF